MSRMRIINGFKVQQYITNGIITMGLILNVFRSLYDNIDFYLQNNSFCYKTSISIIDILVYQSQ